MICELIIVIFILSVTWRTCFSKSSLEPPILAGWLPFIGHGHKLYGDSIKMFRTLREISDECMDKGGVTRLYLGLRRTYVVADPEDCLTISNTCLQKHTVYTFAKSFLGEGLVTTASVPTWKKHRKLLNPAFSQAVLDGFIGTFNDQSRRLVDQFALEAGKPFDYEEMLRMNGLETICLTATGVGAEYTNLQKQYVPLMIKMLNIFCVRFSKVWLHNDFLFNMSKLKKEHDEVIKPLLKLSNSILQKKKAEKKNGTFVTNKSEKLKPFMELILELASETGCFTDEEIRAETDNIISAGHETSATVLSVALNLLGSYLDVQDKVYEELHRVLGNSDKDLEKGDLSKLVYLEAVLKETLRLYPVAPLIGRYIDKDVKLKNFTLAAGSDCLLSLSGVNRHSIWGPDADQFRPERWMDPSTLPDMNYFAGFSLGRRFCIGKVYAMMAMKITMAHVLRRYRVSADINKVVFQWNILMRPFRGHHITLKLRA